MPHNKQFNFKKKDVFIAALFLAVGFFFVQHARAQEIEAKIKIVSTAQSQARIHVTGKFLSSQTVLASPDLSFVQNYADVSDLGKRIENLHLYGAGGERLEIKKLADGEFQTNHSWISYEYDVKADVPSNLTGAAHVSWLNKDTGLLMLNDLLPQSKSAKPVTAKVTIEVPAGWNISTNEMSGNGKNVFDVKHIEKAVFLVGKSWRETSATVDKTNLNLVIAGNDWQFTDDEASAMAGSILQEYRKIFGSIPVSKAKIFLLPFARETSQTDRWRAETRGDTITVVSGIIPLRSQALQRLHEQLRHEIFHLWIPNALNLSGNYDWFFEGFAVYQALRTGVEVNQIRFDDFLNTLARAYDLAAQNQSAPLIEISNKRWANPGVSVYGKGMIVAFLCDAALLRESKGKRSLSDVFREIYQKHRYPNVSQDANSALLAVLKSHAELRAIVSDYIQGTAKIDWQKELNSLGVEVGKNEFGTRLKVSDELNGRQKDLLDKLGYNQWRKLLQKSK